MTEVSVALAPRTASRRRSRARPALVPAAGVAAALLGLAGGASWLADALGGGPERHVLELTQVVGAIAFGLPGALVAARLPGHRVGRLAVVIAACHGLALMAWSYALHAADGRAGGAPLGGAALWLSQWAWVPGYALVPTLLLLHFPDGRLPSPRWRPAGWVAAAGVGLAAAGWALTPYGRGDTTEVPFPPDAVNPLASDALAWLSVAGGALLVPAALAALASLAVRARRSSGTERRAVLTVAAAALLTAALLLLGFAAGPGFAVAATVPLPVAAAVAVLRHGLWDLGGAVDRAQVWARVGERLERPTGDGELLDDVAATLATALRLAWVAIDPGGRAGAPAGPPGIEVPLVHRGERVGTLATAAPAGYGRGEREALEHLAPQVAAAVHGVRLAGELRRSRERLVLAREEERRRLRADLHDELGPTLAVMALELEAAAELPGAGPELADRLHGLAGRARATVDDVRRIVHGLRPPALDDLGLAEALREHAGALARGGPEVVVDAALEGPLPAAVELAAYRIALEALANVARHAGAQHAALALRARAGALELTVRDDGRGLGRDGAPGGVGLRSMRERAEELGGSLTARALPGGGTEIRALLPVEPAR